MSFLAKYDGWCPVCETKITADKDQLRYDQSDRVVHLVCPEESDPTDGALGRNERRCGDCFTIHAGECP